MRMANKWVLVCAGLLITGSLYAGSHGGDADKETKEVEDTKLKPQTTCPIMGGAINKQQYVDKGDQRVFVCCPPCKAKVEADFEGAVQKLAEQGQGPAQAKCPIMRRMTVTPGSRHVDHEGQRIYVCCGSCARAVKADPEAALKTLAEQGVVPARVPGSEDKPKSGSEDKHKH